MFHLCPFAQFFKKWNILMQLTLILYGKNSTVLKRAKILSNPLLYMPMWSPSKPKHHLCQLQESTSLQNLSDSMKSSYTRR